jgi:hypothetical protein
VTLRARWVTLRARWVTLRARWVTPRARWVTLRARWVTLRARWVRDTEDSDEGNVGTALGEGCVAWDALNASQPPWPEEDATHMPWVPPAALAALASHEPYRQVLPSGSPSEG